MPSNYTLKWNQDFTKPFYANIWNNPPALTEEGPCSADGSTGSIWRSHHDFPNGGYGTIGPPSYINLGVDGKSFSTDAGYLTISGFTDSSGVVRGGQLDSVDNRWDTTMPTGDGFSATDGYFEALIKVPQNSNMNWAFWLIGLYGEDHGEVDIAERSYQVPGSLGTELFHTHNWTPSGDNFSANVNFTGTLTVADGWHVFGFWIQPANAGNQMILYIDGKQVFSTAANPLFHTPMSIILDMENLDSVSCKYIRVWAASPTLASDGSAADVQAKINQAQPGDTVTIPNGNFNWNQAVTLSKAVSLKGGGSSTVTAGLSGALSIAFPQSGTTEVSGINFVEGTFAVDYQGLVNIDGNSTGQPANNAVLLFHDCNFTVTSNGEDCILERTNGGVFWNCTFFSNYNDNVGIYLKNSASSTQPGDPWQTLSTMGTADSTGLANTYIEDCTFNGLFLQAINIDDNARVVVRRNTFNDSAIGSHGQETSPWGLRHFEVYNNVFVFHTSGGPYPLNLNYWFEIRGGTGVIFGNTIPDISSQQWGAKDSITLEDFNIQRASNNIPCQTHYPSARQIGQTWLGNGGYSYVDAPIDGTGYGTDPLYIWNNTGGANAQNPGLNDYSPNQCGGVIANYVKLGRDYLLSLKPGYTPLVYPHPLRK